MIKNGILIKLSALEGTFTSNDKTILGGKNSLLSDDKTALFVALKTLTISGNSCNGHQGKTSGSHIWGGHKRLFNDSTELNNYILETLNEIKK